MQRNFIFVSILLLSCYTLLITIPFLAGTYCLKFIVDKIMNLRIGGNVIFLNYSLLVCTNVPCYILRKFK